jgi:hypothetical protein
MIVERLVTEVVYQVSSASERLALSSYGRVSAASTAAGLAAVGFATRLAGQIDATVKAARGLDMTASAYSELQFVADRSGASVEAIRGALTRVTGVLGEVDRGGGRGADALAAIGVSARDAAGRLKAPAELLPEIAEGLRRVDSDGQRAILRQELLGRSASRLGRLLEEGADGFAALTDRARFLGATLSDELATESERLTDAWTDLRALGTGLSYQVGEVLVPAVADLVEGLTDWLAASDGIVRVGLSRAVDALAFVIRGLETPLGRVVGSVVALSGAIAGGGGAVGLARAAMAASPALSALGAALGPLAGTAATVALPLVAVALALDDVYAASQGVDSLTLRLAGSLGVAEEVTRLLGGTVDLLTTSWEAATLIGGDLLGMVGDIGAEITASIPDLSAYTSIYLDWVTGMIPPLRFVRWALAGIMEMDLAGWLQAMIGPLERAVQGWSMLARYASGDQSIEVRQDTSGAGDAAANWLTSPLVVAGARARARATGGDVQQAQAQAFADLDARMGSAIGGIEVGIGSITVGQIGDVARQVGAEVERRLRGEIAAAGAL